MLIEIETDPRNPNAALWLKAIAPLTLRSNPSRSGDLIFLVPHLMPFQLMLFG